MKIEILGISERENGGHTVKIRLSDGEHREYKYLPLTEDDYIRFSPKPKTEIDSTTYEEMEKASVYCRAFDKGMNILSYGGNSKKMLVRKLRQRGFDADTASDTANVLSGYGLINEEGDAESFARSCVSKGYGKRRIVMALRQKGFTDETVANALLSVSDVDFTGLCVTVIKKKYRTIPDDRHERDKIVASLSRYGYTFSEIKEAMNIVING